MTLQANVREGLYNIPESEILKIKRASTGDVVWGSVSSSNPVETQITTTPQTVKARPGGRWAGVSKVSIAADTNISVTFETPEGQSLGTTAITGGSGTETTTPTTLFDANREITYLNVVVATQAGNTTPTVGLSGQPEMLF